MTPQTAAELEADRQRLREACNALRAGHMGKAKKPWTQKLSAEAEKRERTRRRIEGLRSGSSKQT